MCVVVPDEVALEGLGRTGLEQLHRIVAHEAAVPSTEEKQMESASTVDMQTPAGTANDLRHTGSIFAKPSLERQRWHLPDLVVPFPVPVWPAPASAPEGPHQKRLSRCRSLPDRCRFRRRGSYPHQGTRRGMRRRPLS